MNTLGLIIKKFREEKGYTQAELAKKANIGSGTLGDIESGRNKSTIKTINKIADALELTEMKKDELDLAFLGRGFEKKKNSLQELLYKIPADKIELAEKLLKTLVSDKD